MWCYVFSESFGEKWAERFENFFVIIKLGKFLEHNCHYSYCMTCKQFHKKGVDQCFVSKVTPGKFVHHRWVPFDFESTQKPVTMKNGKVFKEHVVNLICARLRCTMCKQEGFVEKNPDCEVCGPNDEFDTRNVCWSSLHVDENGNPRENDWIEHKGERYQVTYSDDPLSKFVDWLESLPAKYESICLAHNGGR